MGIFPASGVWYWGALADPLGYLSGLFSGARRPLHTSPLWLILLAFAGLMVLSERFRGSRRSGELAHAAALLTFLFAAMAISLGPRFSIGSLVQGLPGPFFYLQQLPGFGSMRAPIRFVLLAAFASSALAGVAIAIILRGTRTRTAAGVLVSCLALVILVDTRTFLAQQPVSRLSPPAEVPAVYRWLESTPPGTAVLELPAGIWTSDAMSMFYSLYHGRRLMNGYSAIIPWFADVFATFPSPRSVRALQDADVRYVIAHRERLSSSTRRQLLHWEEREDLSPRWIGSALVLTIPPSPLPAPSPSGERLPPDRWRLEGSAPGADAAADGDLTTHWMARVDASDSYLRIDLGAEEIVTDLTLRLGPHVLEYPRQYRVLSSREGEDWDLAGSANLTPPPFASYRRDHRDVEVPLQISTTRARYLEIRVPQRSMIRAPAVWGVHELQVHVEPNAR
jgi:hypothetical protein